MNIPDLIYKNVLSVFFWVKKMVLKFFNADPDPGSCKPWIRDPGWKNRIRAKHPGPATLANSINFYSSQAGNKNLKN
jgi:hypothetical protein